MRSQEAKTALSTWVICPIACAIGAYFFSRFSSRSNNSRDPRDRACVHIWPRITEPNYLAPNHIDCGYSADSSHSFRISILCRAHLPLELFSTALFQTNSICHPNTDSTPYFIPCWFRFLHSVRHGSRIRIDAATYGSYFRCKRSTNRRYFPISSKPYWEFTEARQNTRHRNELVLTPTSSQYLTIARESPVNKGKATRLPVGSLQHRGDYAKRIAA